MDVIDHNTIPAAETATAAPAADAPSRVQSAHSSILEFIRQHTRRAQLPCRWQFLKTSPFARCLAGPPAELQSLLEASFPLPQLIAAGVLVSDASGYRELSPIFSSDAPFFFRVKSGVLRSAFNLLGETNSSTPPWLALASCHRTRWSYKTRQVLVCFNVDDMHLLHRLGFYCVGGAELTQLAAKDVATVFLKRFEAANDFSYKFLLVGGTLAARLSVVRPTLCRSIQYLLRLERVCDVETETRVKVWLPRMTTRTALTDAAALSDRTRVQQALKQSFKHSSFSAAEAAQIFDNQEQRDLPAARRRLESAVESSCFVPQVHRVRMALRDYKIAVEREVLSDLDRTILSTPVPIDKLAAAGTSELAALFFATHPLVRAAERILAGEFVHYTPRLDDEDLPRRLKVIETITKLVKAYAY